MWYVNTGLQRREGINCNIVPFRNLCFLFLSSKFNETNARTLTTGGTGECAISCFSSWSRLGNEAEHWEHAWDPSTEMLGLIERPRFSSFNSSLMLLDECVEFGVCCCWCCCWCWRGRQCLIKYSTDEFSLSLVRPDANDGTAKPEEKTRREQKIR